LVIHDGENKLKEVQLKTLSIAFLLCNILCIKLEGQNQSRTHNNQTLYQTSNRDTSGLNHSAGSNYTDFILLPFILYAPETGISGGIGFYYVNHDTLRKEIYPYPDETEFYLSYTENKQVNTKIEPVLYFSQKIKFTSRLSYTYFPDLYFGIGNNSPEHNETPYTKQSLILNTSIEKSVATADNKEIYIGFNARFENFGTKFESQHSTFMASAPGYEGSFIGGIGLNITADLRDNVFAPDSGYYFAAEGFYYNNLLNEDFSYLNFTTDSRYYKEIIEVEEGQGHVIAIQNTLAFTSSQVPFNRMPLIGSDMIMRGYYEGRFRDKNSYALQSEYRLPLFWRFRGALFGAIGNVGNSIGNLFLTTPKYAVGFGGRFIWDKTSRLSARLDLGFTEEGMGIYLNIKEAF